MEHPRHTTKDVANTYLDVAEEGLHTVGVLDAVVELRAAVPDNAEDEEDARGRTAQRRLGSPVEGADLFLPGIATNLSRYDPTVRLTRPIQLSLMTSVSPTAGCKDAPQGALQQDAQRNTRPLDLKLRYP